MRDLQSNLNKASRDTRAEYMAAQMANLKVG
jgi:hypothetical protein